MHLHLYHYIRDHQPCIGADKRDSPTPRQEVVVRGYEDERGNKKHKQACDGEEEGVVELERIMVVCS